MPVQNDHPLRIARLRAGMTQVELASEAHVARPLISAMEEGRILTANRTVLTVLARRTGTTPEALDEAFQAWLAAPPRLSTSAEYTLALDPYYVSRYNDFATWMQDIGRNATRFASELRLPRNTVAAYAEGKTEKFPMALRKALMFRLHLTPQYIEALEKLPNGYQRPDEQLTGTDLSAALGAASDDARRGSGGTGAD